MAHVSRKATYWVEWLLLYSNSVTDIEILSKYCKCKSKKYDKDGCFENYSETSGGIEVRAVRIIFQKIGNQLQN